MDPETIHSQTQLVTFSGRSDDLIHLTIQRDGFSTTVEEYNFIDKAAVFHITHDTVNPCDTCGSSEKMTPTTTRGMEITVFYGLRGIWQVAYSILDEEWPLPDWPVRIERDHDYGMSLTVEVPVGAKISLVGEIRMR